MSPAKNGLHPRLLQQCRNAAVKATDDAVLPEHCLREVEFGLAYGYAKRATVTRDPRNPVEFVGRVDQGFGGDAADIEAGSAGLLRLDQHGVHAKLSSADRADI